MKHLPVVRVGYTHGEDPEHLVNREWLVTNGLGGYASGSLGGPLTRRYHGLLIATLPPPLGRTLMLNQLRERLEFAGKSAWLTGQEYLSGKLELPSACLDQFRLEAGIPVWRYSLDGVVLEKRIFMVHGKNTSVVNYRVLEAPAELTLHLQPSYNVRLHEGPLALHMNVDEHGAVKFPYSYEETALGFELGLPEPYPSLRLRISAPRPATFEAETSVVDLLYRVERGRGYDFHGPVFSPGCHVLRLGASEQISLLVSCEAWPELEALEQEAVLGAELERRQHCVQNTHLTLQTGLGAELAIAADQFIITARKRVEAEYRSEAEAKKHAARSVIAGYHWFTDWGRDTMISLEGLALASGRHREAREILSMFAEHMRNGLIPNLFPEHGTEGLYHTADATLWFFHALSRYEHVTGDSQTRRDLMPKLVEILEAHFRGTLFGIGVDPADGLLRQGEDGYQLTWMDAKVDGWVVTPRRGKAVEINALYYNALRLMEEWSMKDEHNEQATLFRAASEQVKKAFNERFWYAEGGYLYDVIDCPEDCPTGRNDAAFRPNQVFAISLPHPVLEPGRWREVLDKVHERLVTPVGLRSLSAEHAAYKPKYDGDLRSRDAAYHQGTVWGWLIGPFFDAWLKVHPEDRSGARVLLRGFEQHLSEACIGTISEIFDAEAPFAPRGCISQAWSVAEVFRVLAISNSSTNSVAFSAGK